MEFNAILIWFGWLHFSGSNMISKSALHCYFIPGLRVVWRRLVVEVGPPPAEVSVAGEGADEGEAVLRVAVVIDRPVVIVRVRMVHGLLVIVLSVVVRPGNVKFCRWLNTTVRFLSSCTG